MKTIVLFLLLLLPPTPPVRPLDIDSAARASDSTNTTTAACGVVAIPGPPDVEAALQDVASLMREVEHTLEDVRMVTVENAILMDSLALVGADV